MEEAEMGSLEEGSELFEIDVGDGKTLYVEVRRGDTIRDLRERLVDAGVTMDVSIDGSPLDEDTNALAYFSALSTNKTGGEEENVAISEEVTEAGSIAIVGSFCSVLSCPTNKFDHPDIALFKFPAQSKRCMDWVNAINRPELSAEPVSHLSQNLAICANHFAQAQFVNGERKILKQNAVPIIFKGNQSAQVKPEAKKTQVMPEAIFVKQELPGDIDDPHPISIPQPHEKGEEDSSMHPGSLCRLCASPISTSAFFIFKLDSNGKTIADKINACLPMSVKKTDVLPKQICQVCSQHLSLHNSFVESCLKAEEKLKSLTQRFLVHGLKSPVLASADGRRGKSKQSYCCPLCCNGAMRYQKQEADSPSPFPPPLSSTQELLSGLYSDDPDSDDANEEEGVLVKIEDTGEPELAIYSPADMALLVYECDVCDEALSDPYNCLEHCKLHCAPEYCPCIVCGLVFPTIEELSEHFPETHMNITAPRRQPWKPLLECGACDGQFTTKKDFILHKCTAPILKTLRGEAMESSCEICERTFRSISRMKSHRESHEGTQMCPCQQCDFEAETPKILNHHVATVHEIPIVHSCPDCSLRFVTAEHAEKHRKVHQTLSYECSLCNSTFNSLDRIQKHIQSHGFSTDMDGDAKPSDFRCSKCGQTFTHRSLLQHHLEITHDTMKRMPSLIQYQCKLCGERITSSCEVLVHRTVHFKGSELSWQFICEYCGESHPSPNALARHRRFLHPDERPYVCTLCDVSTRTLYEARVHRKTHTGHVTAVQKPQPKIYQCEQCPSLYSDKVSFLAHKKSHKVAKWFTCDQCDKSFPERHRLSVHKRQHTGEKPFACGTCGKKFAQTSAMYTHALLHTGETPHECDLCGRKFRIKSDRDNHRRTHTGEKPYKCQYCSKTFRTGQVYYQHRMIHTGERRFPCDVCGRAFKRSHTLVCHRRIHTGEKPNVCDICGKGFRQRTDMRKHKMNLHSVPA